MTDRDEIAIVARAVWGDQTGQCVVGPAHVWVFAVTGERTLLHIEHKHAVQAAKAALASLFEAPDQPAAAPATEPEPAPVVQGEGG